MRPHIGQTRPPSIRSGPRPFEEVGRCAAHLLEGSWASPEAPGGLFWPISTLAHGAKNVGNKCSIEFQDSSLHHFSASIPRHSRERESTEG